MMVDLVLSPSIRFALAPTQLSTGGAMVSAVGLIARAFYR
jgi:hypothetical protein